jgi:inner membrane protein
LNQVAALPVNAQLRNWSRSMGLKLLVVCGLALLMTIPSLFVNNIVEERDTRAKEVMEEIGGRAGGPQTFLGPSLSIPYTIPSPNKGGSPTLGVYVVFPAIGAAHLKVHGEERRRSLFRVPVYQAEVGFDATFDLNGVPSAAPAGAELDWTRAGIVVGVSDARGALADATLTVDGKTSIFTPAESVGEENPRLHLTYFGVKGSRTSEAGRDLQCHRKPTLFRCSATGSFSLRQEHAHCGGGRLGKSGFRRWFLACETNYLAARL